MSVYFFPLNVFDEYFTISTTNTLFLKGFMGREKEKRGGEASDMIALSVGVNAESLVVSPALNLRALEGNKMM